MIWRAHQKCEECRILGIQAKRIAYLWHVNEWVEYKPDGDDPQGHWAHYKKDEAQL